MGPFDSEEKFDWKRLLPGTRAESPKFVLTHGDLSARNIMAH